MNISEFATRSGVSAHTLRYYEKIGLLPAITRNVSGHRDFGEAGLAWVAFVTRLKDTGMPLAEIRRYAEMRAGGAVTVAQRRALLEDHAAALEAEIATQNDHLRRIRDKIAYYRTL